MLTINCHSLQNSLLAQVQFLFYLEEAPLAGLISPVGVRGRELGDVPLTGTVSFRVGVVVPDPLPAVRLLGVTRR